MNDSFFIRRPPPPPENAPESAAEPQAGCPGGPATNPPLPEAERLRTIVESPTYRLAYEDLDLLTQKDLRPLRLQLELLKPERVLYEQGVHSTVVVFGSARVRDAATARDRLAALERLVPGDIAGLKPDVILAPYSGITQDEYTTLSQIAPTVAYADVAWGTSWQDDQLITGKALGMSAGAAKLVSDTEALIASQTDQYPQLAGKTFAYGNMGDGTAFNFYTTTDARSLFLTAIGLEPSEFTKSLDAKAGEDAYFVQVSLELANTIEADIVVMWFGSEDEYSKAQENAAFQAIPAVKEGRFAAVVGESLVMASSAFSVLSIPYMLDQFIPTLAAAADNVK